jgi:hypothetical protein
MTLDELGQSRSRCLVDRNSSVHPSRNLSLAREKSVSIQDGCGVARRVVGTVAMVRLIGSPKVGGVEGIRWEVHESRMLYVTVVEDFSPSNWKISEVQLGQSDAEGRPG